MNKLYEQAIIAGVVLWLQQHAADSARIQRVRKDLVKLRDAINKALDQVPAK